MPDLLANGVAVVTSTGSVLAGVITQDMMSGVLNEIIGCLPVCMPVTVSLIGLRKGISFVMGILHSA